MKTAYTLVAALIALPFISFAAVDCTGIERSLLAMSSADWTARHEGFRAFTSIALGRQDDGATQTRFYREVIPPLIAACSSAETPIEISLIRLLETEHAYQRRLERAKKSFNEVYSDYYGDLIAVVTKFHDLRAIPAILDAVGTGAMASNALIAFGDSAFPEIMRHAERASGRKRLSLLFVFREMLAAGTLLPTHRKEVLDYATHALTGASPLARCRAAEVLATARDDNALTLVRTVSLRDPDSDVRACAAHALTEFAR